MEQKPANAALRSQYSLRIYSWAKKYVEDGAKTIQFDTKTSFFAVRDLLSTLGGKRIGEV